ncbi:MAG TPA: SusC/RagA family TonB-linked outer membrane protein, partial [Chitinophagaceae bacterium]|nr:SusC/RagA family TonB-linked outer membrane protein [Chitinophagaceae bacterium]
TGLKRYTGRANIDNSFGNFKVGLNATLGYSRLVGTRENDTYLGSPLNAIRWFNPYITLTDANGDYLDDTTQSQPNPLRELLENSSSADQVKGVGSAFIEFRVPWIEGLRARTVWGADFTGSENSQYYDRTTQIGSQSTGGNGELRKGYAKTFRYTGTSSLNYQQNLGDHYVSASVFNEIIRSRSDGFGFSGFGLVGPFRNEAGITPGSPTNGYIPTVAGNATQNALLSYFADAAYGFKKRYYLSAGARRDGSSRFGVNRRYANFGQLGASWLVSEEKFLQGTRGWLNQLKYKISYGSVGNQAGIDNFSARELLDPAVYNGSAGLLLTNLVNPNLRWEKKLMFNTGLEFSLFSERLSGTVEYYHNTTKDLFLDRQLSRTSGFSSINTNLGQMLNRGIEVTLNGEVIRSGSFTWNISLNYSYNRNKILKQPGQPENISGILINKEGEKANSLYLVRYAGVNPANGKALYYQKDGKTTTDIYDPGDRIIAGTIDPPYYGGMTNSFNFRGFSLEVLFTYAYGNLIYNNDLFNVTFPGYYFSNLSTELLSEWKKPGDITNVPSPFNEFQSNTTRFAEKGDHIRLRNVTLGYELPKNLLQQWKINSLRFFAQGQNLYVWHNFQGYDPEVTFTTFSGAQYPQLKTITFGLNLGL